MIAAAVIGVRVTSGRAFDTDIQSLLPQNALEPIIRAAMVQAGSAASSRVEILVSSETPERAAEAAAALEHDLNATGVFESDREGGADVGRWLFANRNALICEPSAAAFNGEAARGQALGMLYAPGAPISGEMLVRDPFLRTLTLAQCLAPRGAGAETGGALVSGRLSQSAFRIDVQDKFGAAYDAWRAQWSDVRAARAGALFYAADSAAKVRNEVSLIGTVSLIIVILALLIPFRRARPVLLTLAVTAAGAIGSLGMALLVFPTVHVLVFVFGSALIGVTSDYAVHYLATGPTTKWAPSAERVKLVFRPLIVCAAATSLGFASLCLFDVALFNQVAVFSIAGIVTAWWFTLTLLPMLDPAPKDPEKLSAWWSKLESVFSRVRWPRWAPALGLAAIALICVIAVLRFHTLDDVRQFQPLSPVLKAEEQEVREATGFAASPRFLLSHGASADDALAHEERALAALPDEARALVLASSRFNPSPARRAENERAVRERLYDPFLTPWSAMLGLTPDPFAVVQTDLPHLVRDLSGQAGDQAFVIAPLGAADVDVAPAVDNVVLVDPANRYSAAFAAYRNYAVLAFFLAFGVCAAVVLLVYRTPRALSILIGPAIGAVMAVAAPSALGMPASFFSVCALFVVIGTGVDHSVFRYESAHAHGEGIDLSVFLSMLTTIASMGLLAISSAYPVRIFGVAVAAGVTSAYIFSFIAERVARGDKT